MKSSQYKILTSVIGTYLVLFSLPSQANFNWTFTGGGGVCSSPCSMTDTVAGETIKVTATGYQATGINSQLQTAQMNVWSGLAVHSNGESNSTPQHATDNNGSLESILFSFDKAVDLTSITMGWHEDADFSLLRYTGSGANPLTSSSTYNNLESNSWELVGNYTYSAPTYYYSNGNRVSNYNSLTNSDITASVYASSPDNFTGPRDEAGTSTSSAHTSSSHWLVASLNGAFWNNNNYIGNDYFKLQTLSATYTPPSNGGSIPEPSTAALMSISMAAFGFTRRRRKTKIPAVTV